MLNDDNNSEDQKNQQEPKSKLTIQLEEDSPTPKVDSLNPNIIAASRSPLPFQEKPYCQLC